MEKLDLVTVGACNIDLVAEVDRIPESDDEVSICEFEMKAGGSAANVACMASKLGHMSGFVGMVGEDRFGDFLLEELNKNGVDTSQVKRKGHSGMVIAITRGEDRYLYTFGGSARSFHPTDIPEDYIKKAKVVHLASIDSPLGIETVRKASLISSKSGAKVVFDPGHLFIDMGLNAIKPILKNTYAFLPSQSELRKLIDCSLPEVGKNLLSLGPQVILITRGQKGCYLISKDFEEGIPSFKVGDIKNSLGAGDAFSAGFISGLLQNKNLSEAARLANFIASKSLKCKGATFLDIS
jgi:sugar/nucleoside kinase (ribokinase family)